MENEIRHLNETIMKIKIEAEEEMRERIVRMQEEEYRKYSVNIIFIYLKI